MEIKIIEVPIHSIIAGGFVAFVSGMLFILTLIHLFGV